MGIKTLIRDLLARNWNEAGEDYFAESENSRELIERTVLRSAYMVAAMKGATINEAIDYLLG